MRISVICKIISTSNSTIVFQLQLIELVAQHTPIHSGKQKLEANNYNNRQTNKNRSEHAEWIVQKLFE